MQYIVSKFGGTSLAKRDVVEAAIDIMLSDDRRKFMVVSAPGARSKVDRKVTDLLINAGEKTLDDRVICLKPSECIEEIGFRMAEIGKEVPETVEELRKILEETVAATGEKNYLDRVKAFGEYASARLLEAKICKRLGPKGAKVVTPKKAGLIGIPTGDGDYEADPACFEKMGKVLLAAAEEYRVVLFPGFYLRLADGTLVTMSRQSTDRSSTYVANATNAYACENWTDVTGLKVVNPKLVEDITQNPPTIERMTFLEARELSYRDFKLHEDTMTPVMVKHIPINVRNTEEPDKEGTWIMHDRMVPSDEQIIGVACAAGKVPFGLARMLMNRELGFMRTLAGILEEKKISFEHVTTGIDSTTVYFDTKYVGAPGDLNDLMRVVAEKVGPIEHGPADPIAIVAAVGMGLDRNIGGAGRVVTAIENAGIKPLMIDYGPPRMSIFVGVDERRADDAVRAVYREFFVK